MGTGQRGLAASTRLSSRSTLREVTANDANIDDVVEVLDTREPEGVGIVTRGDHASLVLYTILDGGATAATISLYGKCDDEQEESSSSADAGDGWSFYDDWTVDVRNLMVVLPDMPASEYKVMVAGIAGTGTVVIRTQHSE